MVRVRVRVAAASAASAICLHAARCRAPVPSLTPRATAGGGGGGLKVVGGWWGSGVVVVVEGCEPRRRADERTERLRVRYASRRLMKTERAASQDPHTN